MSALRRLVVATDLTARSDRAVERAVALSAETGAALTVVHVVDGDLPARVADRQVTDAEEVIAAHLQGLPVRPAAVEVKVVRGFQSEDILAVAEQAGADMVLVGIHRNEPPRLFVGTTAEQVIRRGALPVLTVKDLCLGPYRRVTIAVDFSVYARRAISFAVRMFPDAEFRLLHAYEAPFKGLLSGVANTRDANRHRDEELRRLVEDEFGALVAALEQRPQRYAPVVREGPVRLVIHADVEEERPDLLVVGTHGRTGVAAAVLGSVAQDLLGDPPCDVLTVKAW